MKIKTYKDDRTLWEFLDHVEYNTGKYLQKDIYPKGEQYDELIAKAPKRNCLDIQLMDDNKSTDAELFTKTLFYYYWLIEGLNGSLPYDPKTTRELPENFTVEAFCRHHEVISDDLEDIKMASLFRSQRDFKNNYNVDDYRAEILEQVEIYIKGLPKTKTINQIPDLPEPGQASQVNQVNKLTQTQIALKSVYEGLTITRENASEIAIKYGQQSGQRLYQKFCYYQSLTNRKAKPDPPNKKKFQNKINLFESVIELLENPYKQRAIDELKILKTIFENEFE